MDNLTWGGSKPNQTKGGRREGKEGLKLGGTTEQSTSSKGASSPQEIPENSRKEIPVKVRY